jgi:hypothetical protein
VPVLTDETAMVAAAVDPDRSGRVITCPLTSLKVPRTRLISLSPLIGGSA